MGAFSPFGRGALLDALLRPDRAALLGGLWLALTKTPPSSADMGASLDEPDAASYQRRAYGVGSYWWVATGPGVVTNAQAIDWPTPSDDWGQVTGWALCTESTSGMTLASGVLRRAMTITQGTRPRVSPGSLRLSLQ